MPVDSNKGVRALTPPPFPPLSLAYQVTTCKIELFEIELFDHLTECKQMSDV